MHGTVAAPMRTDSATAVELTGINKTFGDVRVLRDLAFQVERGAVHALLGGNGSGKSTTLKILAGVHRADAGGSVAIHGQRSPTETYSARIARDSGLRFVHQDLGLIPDLTVSENFGLDGGYPRRAGVAISWRRLVSSAQEYLDRAHVDVDPRRLVRDLRPSDKTLVAIARALRDSDKGSHVTLVLDEPTASLPQQEVSALLEAIQRCRDQGQTIIYVSHRLSEVLSIADRVSVLRDGVVVADSPAARLNESDVVALMTGASTVKPIRSGRRVLGAGVALSVSQLAAGPVREVTFDVGKGEIVGVAGLLGSGRSALLRTLFGQRPIEHGRIEVDGAAVHPRSATDAIRSGFALVPEDRARDAAFADQTLRENVSATAIRQYWAGWRMVRAAERRDAEQLIRDFAIVAASSDAGFSTLSGGNQQKAVLARWFRHNPRLLLLDEPTQGVDAMARAQIHAMIREHIDTGAAALVVSSDFDELEELCDRVIIIRDGISVAELSGAEMTEAAITALTQTSREEFTRE